MIDLRVKQLFFDAKRVTDAVDRARLKVLSKVGAFVRQRAKTSIKKRPHPSPPGTPPSSHTGILRKFIFFSYDDREDSVVIGPAPAKKATSDTPSLLEFGGHVKTKRVTYVRAKSGRDAKGRFKKDRVVKVPAGTAMTYRPRPYMGPALKEEVSKLPSLWANSVKAK